MKENVVIEQTLMGLPSEAKEKFDNYPVSDFEKAIVIDLFGLDGTYGLSWAQITDKYKNVSDPFKRLP